ncbi:ACP S-malonyltransferase [Tuberibacillus calidus]|jgi:[acyl-carrier-protein] S-malonyltransferase|uniref:ACP S-malonyltransferase n=1 Tax=Tuberibacillus calidus TaxID=340097 RepID=UPI000421D678|nr:ACP S-malonyltransferase [Tuberibacillus calidus]
MGKIAFIFPGQGSQAVGMTESLVAHDPDGSQWLDRADARLGYALSDIIKNGPEERLTLTENAQPAILTASMVALSLLQKAGITPDYVAGHSLGEYSALVAASALSFEDAVYAVRQRGLFMEEAVPAGVGAMAAILGLAAEDLEAICAEVSQQGDTVEIANLNCPGQIAISGTKEGVEKASALAKEKGAKRAIPLNVSGPFHSSLMKPAAEKMKAVLAEITVKDAEIPVVANVTADFVTEKDDIKRLLIEQLYSPVRWIETIQKLRSLGVDTFVEVGPGKVLSGLVKKIDKTATMYATYDQDQLIKTIEALKGGE